MLTRPSVFPRLGNRRAGPDATLHDNRPLEEPVMLLVGLTGNIGSGKSTVAQMLSERGATIIDADVLARRAVEAGTPAYEKIVERWGTSIVGPDKQLDRGALRRTVFS